MQCQVANAFLEVLGTLSEAQKGPGVYGSGHKLYQAEIRFLTAVHENPSLKASRLSRELGITGGAVTQMAGRLAEKGLLEQYTATANRKEKFYRLTPAGEGVRAGYESQCDEANQRLCRYFRALSPEESGTVLRFMRMLKDIVPICAFQCSCTQEKQACVQCGKGKEILC